MGKRVLSLATISMLFLLSGCGTVVNLAPDSGMFHLDGTTTRRVYGGVQLDASFATKCVSASVDHYEPEFGRAGTFALGAYTLCVDLPISLVADTLTLPYVLYKGPGGGFLGQVQSPSRHQTSDASRSEAQHLNE